jgi:hypothetical protein
MTAVALRSRFFDHQEGLGGNLLRVLSTIIVSSLVASIGFAQVAKSEKTGRHRSLGRQAENAADAAIADYQAEQAAEPVEMLVGSPPMVSDDTGTPGNSIWEINVVVAGDISEDSKAFELPLIDINYGVGDRLQLKYEVPYLVTRDVRLDEKGERTTEQASGLSSSKVGVKYRFYDNDQAGLSLAVYPQVEFRTPGSKLEGEPDEGGEGGVAEEGVTHALPILLTKEFQHASITANLGAERTAEDNLGVAASFGVGTRLTDGLAVMGEIAGQNLNRADERRILLNVGFRLKLSAKQAFVGSVGHDIQDGADGQKHLNMSLAYQHFFQPRNR